MAAGKQQQGVVAASAEEPGVARRLWRVVRAVMYMLRRGLPSSGRKLAMDLHLLLHRSKIAGRALGDLFVASHHGRHAAAFSYDGAGSAGGAFSCRALDPRLAVHEPSRGRREVEFSCSNTPSSASGAGGLGLLGAAKRRCRRRSRQQQQQQQRERIDEAAAAAVASNANGYLQSYYGYDAAEVAWALEMLNDDEYDYDSAVGVRRGSSTTPSPAAQPLYVATPGAGGSSRQQALVVAGSPAEHGGQVDRRADEFIRRFYEQLRAQRSAVSTPDYYGYAATSPYGGTARPPRPVTAGGIA